MANRTPPKRAGAVEYVFDDEDSATLLLELAIGFALRGGALRIGLTRDGGALALGLYMGDVYSTEYIRPSEDLAIELRKIAAAWDIYPAAWDDVAQRYIAT